MNIKTRYHIKAKAIALTVALLLLINDISFALSPEPGTRRAIVKCEYQALLWIRSGRLKFAETEEETRSLKEPNKADVLLLPDGKILADKDLARDPLKLIRKITHEEIEAILQIMAAGLRPGERARYSAIINLVLSRSAIREKYYGLFPEGRRPELDDELLANDILATAFELLIPRMEGLVEEGFTPQPEGHTREGVDEWPSGGIPLHGRDRDPALKDAMAARPWSFTPQPEGHTREGVDEWPSGGIPLHGRDRDPALKDAMAVRPWSVTSPAESEFLKAIEPVINASRHNYFDGLFWDGHVRRDRIRVAMANGMRFRLPQTRSAQTRSAQTRSESESRKKFIRSKLTPDQFSIVDDNRNHAANNILKVLAQGKLPDIFPYQIQLDLTRFCPKWELIQRTGAGPKDCLQCAFPEKSRHEVSHERLVEILRNFESRGGRSVFITGGGEPGAYTHWHELFEFFAGSSLGLTMNTNGHFVRRMASEDAGTLRKVFSAEKEPSIISISAHDDEAYAAAKQLDELRDGMGLNIVIRASLMVHADTSREDILEFLKKSRASGVDMVAFKPTHILRDDELIFNVNQDAHDIIRRLTDEQANINAGYPEMGHGYDMIVQAMRLNRLKSSFEGVREQFKNWRDDDAEPICLGPLCNLYLNSFLRTGMCCDTKDTGIGGMPAEIFGSDVPADPQEYFIEAMWGMIKLDPHHCIVGCGFMEPNLMYPSQLGLGYLVDNLKALRAEYRAGTLAEGEAKRRLRAIFKRQDDPSARRSMAVGAVQSAWEDVRGNIERFDPAVAAKKEAFLSRFYAAMSSVVEKLKAKAARGEIDPFVKLRALKFSEDSAGGLYETDREMRVGFLAIAGNPLNWGHVLISFMSMNEWDLDTVIFRTQGEIAYKKLLASERVGVKDRHMMVRDAIKGLYPLIRYTDLGSEENNDVQGEEEAMRFLEMNPDRKIHLYFMVGAETEERMWRCMRWQYDNLIKYSFGKNPKHKITFAVIQRGEYGARVTLDELRGISKAIQEEKGAPALLDVAFVKDPDIDLNVSSTYYRNTQDGAFVPKAVHEFAKSRGYYGHPPIDPITGQPVTASQEEYFRKRLEPVSREMARQVAAAIEAGVPGDTALVSLDGGSGSGKTTIAEEAGKFLETTGRDTIVVPLDMFLKDRGWRLAIQKLVTGRKLTAKEAVLAGEAAKKIKPGERYADEEEFFDHEAIRKMLRDIDEFRRSGREDAVITVQNAYDQNTKTVAPRQFALKKGMVIIFEGKYANEEALQGYYDLRYRLHDDPDRTKARFEIRSRRQSPADADMQIIFYGMSLVPSFEAYDDRTKGCIDGFIDLRGEEWFLETPSAKPEPPDIGSPTPTDSGKKSIRTPEVRAGKKFEAFYAFCKDRIKLIREEIASGAELGTEMLKKHQSAVYECLHDNFGAAEFGELRDEILSDAIQLFLGAHYKIHPIETEDLKPDRKREKIKDVLSEILSDFESVIGDLKVLAERGMLLKARDFRVRSGKFDPLKGSPKARTERTQTRSAQTRSAQTRSGEVSHTSVFEAEAERSGGKIAWTKITEELAGQIGYKTPPSRYLAINELWTRFIEANKELVRLGNRALAEGLSFRVKPTKETAAYLTYLRRQFIFPAELEILVKERAAGIAGPIIARSSQRKEDSFERNLAGVFTSRRKPDARHSAEAVKEVFMQSLGVFWGAAYEGIAREVSAEEGVGILLQPFLSFDAAGTCMSNRYGHTVVEAVFGDADTAVAGEGANICQFINKKGSDAIELNPSYIDNPHNFRLKDKKYSVDEDPAAMKNAVSGYPIINGKRSPLSEAQAKEIARVAGALEERIGAPLDIEWGVLNGELYIIQVRPDTGRFDRPLVEPSEALKNKPLRVRTPIALGDTSPEGFTGKMVIFGSGISDDEIRSFEQDFARPYIRVQSDAASGLIDGKSTLAKVLVDPVQGQAQAHNVSLITSRIRNGEFAYCVGPVLGAALRGMEFHMHPKYKRIWVSSDTMTYFSDGLRGELYYGGHSGQPFGSDVRPNEEFIAEEIASLAAKEYKFEEAIELAADSAFFRYDRDLRKDMIKGLLACIDDPDPIQKLRKIAEKAMTREDEELGKTPDERLADLMPEIAALGDSFDIALSYPLLPEERQSEWIAAFRKIARLEELAKFTETEEQPAAEDIYRQRHYADADKDRFRVIVVDDDEAKRDKVVAVVEEVLSGQKYTIASCADYKQAAEAFETAPADLVVFDVQMPCSRHKNSFFLNVRRTPFGVICSGFDDKDSRATLRGSLPEEVRRRLGYSYDDLKDLRPCVKDAVESKQRILDKIAKENAAAPQVAPAAAAPQAAAAVKTVFVLADEGGEAEDLAKFIREHTAGAYRVEPMSLVYQLERSMDPALDVNLIPDIVITDTHIGGKEVLAEVILMAAARNPACRFIVTGDETALPSPAETAPVSDRAPPAASVISFVEKPFHFTACLDLLRPAKPAPPDIGSDSSGSCGTVIDRRTIGVPAEKGTEMEPYLQIIEFIRSHPGIAEDSHANIEEALVELILNVAEHGHGGTVELILREDAVSGTRVLEARAEDHGPGLPCRNENDLTEMFIGSVNAASGGHGHGFALIVFTPDICTIEFRGRAYLFDSANMRFVASGPSDVHEGTRISLSFAIEGGRDVSGAHRSKGSPYKAFMLLKAGALSRDEVAGRLGVSGETSRTDIHVLTSGGIAESTPDGLYRIKASLTSAQLEEAQRVLAESYADGRIKRNSRGVGMRQVIERLWRIAVLPEILSAIAGGDHQPPRGLGPRPTLRYGMSGKNILAELLTSRERFAQTKARGELPDLTGLDIGATNGSGEILLPVMENYVYRWRGLGLDEAGWKAKIVGTAIRYGIYEITVSFSKEGLSDVVKTFQIGPMTRAINGVNKELGKKATVLDISECPGRRALCDFVYPHGRAPGASAPDLNGLVGLRLGRTDSQGRYYLAPRKNFLVHWHALGFPESGWEGRIVSVRATGRVREFKVIFTRQGKPAVARKFQISIDPVRMNGRGRERGRTMSVHPPVSAPGLDVLRAAIARPPKFRYRPDEKAPDIAGLRIGTTDSDGHIRFNPVPGFVYNWSVLGFREAGWEAYGLESRITEGILRFTVELRKGPGRVIRRSFMVGPYTTALVPENRGKGMRRPSVLKIMEAGRVERMAAREDFMRYSRSGYENGRVVPVTAGGELYDGMASDTIWRRLESVYAKLNEQEQAIADGIMEGLSDEEVKAAAYCTIGEAARIRKRLRDGFNGLEEEMKGFGIVMPATAGPAAGTLDENSVAWSEIGPHVSRIRRIVSAHDGVCMFLVHPGGGYLTGPFRRELPGDLPYNPDPAWVERYVAALRDVIAASDGVVFILGGYFEGLKDVRTRAVIIRIPSEKDNPIPYLGQRVIGDYRNWDPVINKLKELGVKKLSPLGGEIAYFDGSGRLVESGGLCVGAVKGVLKEHFKVEESPEICWDIGPSSAAGRFTPEPALPKPEPTDIGSADSGRIRYSDVAEKMKDVDRILDEACSDEGKHAESFEAAMGILSNIIDRIYEMGSARKFLSSALLVRDRLDSFQAAVSDQDLGPGLKEYFTQRITDLTSALEAAAAEHDIDMEEAYASYVKERDRLADPYNAKKYGRKTSPADRDEDLSRPADDDVEAELRALEKSAGELAAIAGSDPKEFRAGLKEFRAELISFIDRYRMKDDPDLAQKFGARRDAIGELLSGAIARAQTAKKSPNGPAAGAVRRIEIASPANGIPEEAAFTSSLRGLEDAAWQEFGRAAGEADGATAACEKRGQSLALYADDIMESAMVVDLEHTIKNIISKRNILAGGKIVLYAKDPRNAAVLGRMIKHADPGIETVMMTREDLELPDNADEVKEADAVIRRAAARGAGDMLGLIKGRTDKIEELAELANDRMVPIVILAPSDGVYSFAQAIAMAMDAKARNGSAHGQPSGRKGWLMMLLPIRPLTDDIRKQYEDYRASLVALAAA